MPCLRLQSLQLCCWGAHEVWQLLSPASAISHQEHLALTHELIRAFAPCSQPSALLGPGVSCSAARWSCRCLASRLCHPLLVEGALSSSALMHSVALMQRAWGLGALLQGASWHLGCQQRLGEQAVSSPELSAHSHRR